MNKDSTVLGIDLNSFIEPTNKEVKSAKSFMILCKDKTVEKEIINAYRSKLVNMLVYNPTDKKGNLFDIVPWKKYSGLKPRVGNFALVEEIPNLTEYLEDVIGLDLTDHYCEEDLIGIINILTATKLAEVVISDDPLVLFVCGSLCIDVIEPSNIQLINKVLA